MRYTFILIHIDIENQSAAIGTVICVRVCESVFFFIIHEHRVCCMVSLCSSFGFFFLYLYATTAASQSIVECKFKPRCDLFSLIFNSSNCFIVMCSNFVLRSLRTTILVSNSSGSSSNVIFLIFACTTTHFRHD